MHKRHKYSRKVISLFLLSFITVGLYGYIEIWMPSKTLTDIAWVKRAASEEIRDLSHQVISRRFGNHHDAFIYLTKIGNGQSVPLLIRALKWHDNPGDNFVECTTTHNLEALRSLTGQNPGRRYEDWHHWWDESGVKLASEEFYPREK